MQLVAVTVPFNGCTGSELNDITASAGLSLISRMTPCLSVCLSVYMYRHSIGRLINMPGHHAYNTVASPLDLDIHVLWEIYRESPSPDVPTITCHSWTLVCSSEENWHDLVKTLKKSNQKQDKRLRKILVNDFLPLIPEIITEKVSDPISYWL